MHANTRRRPPGGGVSDMPHASLALLLALAMSCVAVWAAPGDTGEDTSTGSDQRPSGPLPEVPRDDGSRDLLDSDPGDPAAAPPAPAERHPLARLIGRLRHALDLRGPRLGRDDNALFGPTTPDLGDLGRVRLQLDRVEPGLGDIGLLEPLTARSADEAPTWLLNLDLDFSNVSGADLWIDRVEWSYPSAGAPAPAQVSAWDLLTEYADPVKKRHLFKGGWRVFGAETSLLDGRGAYFNDIVARLAPGGLEHFGVGVRFAPGARFTVSRLLADGELDRYASPLPFDSVSTARAVAASGSWMMVAGWLIEDGQRRAVVARVSASSLDLSNAWGEPDDDGRSGYRRIALPGVELLDVVDITNVNSQVWVLAEVRRFGFREIAIIGLDTNGDLDPAFGDGGIRYIRANPLGYNTDVRPAGIGTISLGGERRILVAGSAGTGCNHNAPGGDCRMFVRRHRANGNPDFGYGIFGTRLIDFPGAFAQAAEDLVLDSSGAAYVGGWAKVSPGSQGLRWASAKLTPQGGYDGTWGEGGGDGINDLCFANCQRSGRVVHSFSGERGVIRALALRNDSELVAGGWAVRDGQTDFAVGVYTGNGEGNWGDWGFASIPGFDGWAMANGITVDNTGRVVAAGSSNRSLYGDAGTYQSSVRFSADGILDTRLHLAPGDQRELKLPEWRELAVAAGEVDVRIVLRGGGGETFAIPLLPHDNGLRSGYLFPLDGLAANEYFATGQHHVLGSNHRQSRSQRMAYDFSLNWVDPTGEKAARSRGLDAEGKQLDRSQNGNYLIWGKTVRAISDGVVLSCFSMFPDNEKPGVENEDVKAIAGGGNMFWIRHDTGEVALYAHLQSGTVNANLCPTPPGCNSAVPDLGCASAQGTAVGGQVVNRGDVLGLVGNSGASTGPHLHFHIQTDSGSLATIADEGLPALFGSSVEVIRKTDLQDQKTDFATAQRQAVPFSTYVRNPY